MKKKVITVMTWICDSCGAENSGNFCTECGSARPVKVYVGRRSLSMGDDVNHPNMFSFYLSDDPGKVVDDMFSHGLPNHVSWKGCLGRPEKSGCEEDGVVVYSKISDEVIFQTRESERHDKLTYEFTEGWYEKIKAHPYIYCE